MDNSTRMTQHNLGLLEITPESFNGIYYMNTSGKVLPDSQDVADGEIPRLLQVVIRPILVVLGTYGNALSFYIMRRGSLREVSTCFYMAALAVADTRKLNIN